MVSTCRVECDAFFHFPAAPSKESSEPFVQYVEKTVCCLVTIAQKQNPELHTVTGMSVVHLKR